MKKIFILFIAFILFQEFLIGQNFDRTLSLPNIDFNHYSIESNSNGHFICAGTLFDPSGNTDIHVLELDGLGNTVWEFKIDKSQDDRALDLVVDAMGDIIVTGYISPRGGKNSDLYLLKLNPSGKYIIDKSFEISNANAGTKIIHSSNSNTYIVGGLTTLQLVDPLLFNEAIVLEVDLNLKYINHNQFSSSYMSNSSVNDIVEIPTGYFITGGIGMKSSSGHEQGVLAMQLDYQLKLANNISFISSNAFHIGVSMVYNNQQDQIYLMSNNSEAHYPQITIINDASFGPNIFAHYLLDFYAYNPAGFKLLPSNSDPNNLIACGYFQGHINNSTTSATSGHASPWIIEFDAMSGNQVAGYYWTAPSNNFHTHGGGIFSTFSAPYQKHFNQEILCENPNGLGYTFVGAREENGNFGLDVISLNSLDFPECFEPLTFTNKDTTSILIPVKNNKKSAIVKSPKCKLSNVYTDNLIPECTIESCPQTCEALVELVCGIEYEISVPNCINPAPNAQYSWTINDLGVSSQSGQIITVSSLGGSYVFYVGITYTNQYGFTQTCLVTGTVTIPLFDCTQFDRLASISHVCENDYTLDVSIDPSCISFDLLNVKLSKINGRGGPGCVVIGNGSGSSIPFNIANCGYGDYELMGQVQIIDDANDTILCPIKPYDQEIFVLNIAEPCNDDILVYGKGYNSAPPFYLGCDPNATSYLEYKVYSPVGSCYEYYWNGNGNATGPVYECCYSDPFCGSPSVLIKNICNCCEYLIEDVNDQFQIIEDTEISLIATLKQDTSYLEKVVYNEIELDLNNINGEHLTSVPDHFIIYPNPSTGISYLNFRYETERSISIIDMHGKLLFKEESQDKTVMLNLDFINAGIYLMSVRSHHSGKITNKKIVIN